jgi:selenide,water dikinase
VRRVAPPGDPNLLVGALTGDDAAVWRLSDERALVLTADFITPVVDDARAWGRIAAANAVSDVYAMGGTPLLALNLVGWNVDELPTELLGDVLEGGGEIAAAAGFVVAGGHTVDDPEPKYGMAVVGEVHPDRILTNAGLRPGDVLVLTKPLGIGITTTAIKADRCPEDLIGAAIASMTRLNALAADAARAAGATGCTDVTGFGLLGHLLKLARASGVTAVVDAAAVPYLDGAREALAAGFVSGGTRRNLDWVRPHTDLDAVSEDEALLLADAQTSGGLLLAGEIPGHPVIGELVPRGGALVVVR